MMARIEPRYAGEGSSGSELKPPGAPVMSDSESSPSDLHRRRLSGSSGSVIDSRLNGGRACGRGLRRSWATSRNRTRAESSASCLPWTSGFAGNWASGRLRGLSGRVSGTERVDRLCFRFAERHGHEADSDQTISRDVTDPGPTPGRDTYLLGRPRRREGPAVD